MQNLRRISQGIFLLLFVFLFLQTESTGSDELGYPAKLFLDFDPLILLTTLLASHSAAKAFWLSIITVILTVILGRVFCGWVCPLGTLHNMVGALKKRDRKERTNWHRVKYLILIFLLTSSLFRLHLVGILDPISLLIRSLAIGVYPPFNLAVRSFFDTIYELDPPGLVNLTEWMYSGLKATVLAFKQPQFRQSFFIGVIFITILGLNFYEKRFWCRYLCPLGALLGLLSRFSILKRSVSEDCNECGACGGVCPGHASPDVKEGWRDSECYYCWNCDDICPNNAVHFGFMGKKTTPAMDLGTRRVFLSSLCGMVAVPLMRSIPGAGSAQLQPKLIRPPGSLAEHEFLRRCVKCGECMKVCTTNGLQPTLLEAGLEGIWSPVLVPRIGYCEYRCTLCGQVCPTGAIERLELEDKKKVRLGLAMVDKNRCLPWSHATPCIVCEEVCPTSKKAIWLEKAEVEDRNGNTLTVQRPRVDLSLCIGCGICETKCPVGGKAAIYVTNIGESRSEDNRLLLPESSGY